MRTGDRDVAANFWSGFAQGATGVLGEASAVVQDQQQSVEGESFDVVRMVMTTGSERVIVLQSGDGYRVDLFASFASGLAS